MVEQSENIPGSTLTLFQVRLFIVVGALLLASFMFADLALLPSTLTSVYVQSRLFIQIPLCMAFLLYSFHASFAKHFQSALALIMLAVTYANYWVIFQCWQLAQFSFPYEGTVMYSLFTLIVFRMQFRTAVFFSLTLVTGFAALAINYPIYGANTGVSVGFVVMGSVVGLLSVFQVERAMQRLSQANAQLRILSQIDPLTETYNRRTYEARFTTQLNCNRRAGNSICVFVIDLDNFKDYNDGYGHVAGDKVIKQQADQLKDIFRRESDIVARYGGEEFVVVTSNVTVVQCEAFAQAILDKWANAKEPHGQGAGREYVSCSVGFYIEPISLETNTERMVKKADLALYQAKAEGRNRYCQFQSE